MVYSGIAKGRKENGVDAIGEFGRNEGGHSGYRCESLRDITLATAIVASPSNQLRAGLSKGKCC